MPVCAPFAATVAHSSCQIENQFGKKGPFVYLDATFARLHQEILCSYGFPERFNKYAFIVFQLWVLDLIGNANQNIMKIFSQWVIWRRNNW